jgi:hypothetical protein
MMGVSRFHMYDVASVVQYYRILNMSGIRIMRYTTFEFTPLRAQCTEQKIVMTHKRPANN